MLLEAQSCRGSRGSQVGSQHRNGGSQLSVPFQGISYSVLASVGTNNAPGTKTYMQANIRVLSTSIHPSGKDSLVPGLHRAPGLIRL